MDLTSTKHQLLDDFGNDLSADVSWSNKLNDITAELMNYFEAKRTQIITERLKKIIGVELNIEEESKRRFKRFAIEYNGNEETIYYNDGSESGIRIVTFVRDEQPLNFEPLKETMRTGFSYY